MSKDLLRKRLNNNRRILSNFNLDMQDDDDSLSDEEPQLFRVFTRESLQAIHARIAVEQAKLKELERKRAEGEVNYITCNDNVIIINTFDQQ